MEQLDTNSVESTALNPAAARSAILALLSALFAMGSTGAAVFWYPAGTQTNRQRTTGLVPVLESSDLGEIQQGKLLASVRLRNELPHPVRIIRVGTTCRCTAAKASSEPIQPGAERQLQFEWNTLGIRGPSSTGLIVHFMEDGTDASRQTVIAIHGRVQPRFDVIPATLEFNVDSPRKAQVELRDKTLGRQPVIESFNSESPAVSVERLSDSSVEVTFDPSKWQRSPGFRPKLKLDVNVETDPSIEVPIHVK